jgi:hypothetical protein
MPVTLPGKALIMMTSQMHIKLKTTIFPGVQKEGNYLHTANKQDYVLV